MDQGGIETSRRWLVEKRSALIGWCDHCGGNEENELIEIEDSVG